MNDFEMGFRHTMLQRMQSYNVSPAKMSPTPPPIKSPESACSPTSTQSVTDFSINRILGEDCEKNLNMKTSTTTVPLIKPTPQNASTSTNSAGILDLSKSASNTNENIGIDIAFPFYRHANYAHIFNPDFLAATKFYAHFFPHMFPASHLSTSMPTAFPKRFFAPYIVNSTIHPSTSLSKRHEDLKTSVENSQAKATDHIRVDCASCLKYPSYKSMNQMPVVNSFPTTHASYNGSKASGSSLVLNSSATISLTAVTNMNLSEQKNLKVNGSIDTVCFGNTPTPLTEEISYKCRICDKVFGCSQTLQAHEKTHKSPRYECTDCGKGFSQLRNYKYHLSVHRGTKEFAAECPECGKTFNDKGYLSSHMKIHRNKKEYECPYCPKSFNQRVAFNMHVRIHTGVKPHKCAECGKRFSRKMLLKQHMRTHSGEKPYQCSVCGKSFADRSNMTLHHRLHSGIKPFNCPICPKAFTKKHHLKTHLNYHTGCKPYVCPHPNCNQAFTQSSNMRTHAKKCQYRPLQMSALPLNSPGGQHMLSMPVCSTTSVANATKSSSTPSPSTTNLLASHFVPTSGHIASVTPRHVATPLAATFSAGIRMLNAVAANTSSATTATVTSSSRSLMTSKSTTLTFPPTQPLLSTLRPL